MLKFKLTKDEHGALADGFKTEYKLEGEVYVLDTDVKFEDVTPLKNALVQEKQARKLATEKNATLESQITDLTARAGTATDLEKSWKEKLETASKAAEEKRKGLDNQIRRLLVDNVATSMASEISTTPNVLLPHIQKRLTIEEVDGEYVTRVLTPDGKASALSANELKAEFLANKDFAPIITASKASGGGANGNKGPASGKSFKEMNEAERTHLFKTDRAAFDKGAAELKAQT